VKNVLFSKAHNNTLWYDDSSHRRVCSQLHLYFLILNPTRWALNTYTIVAARVRPLRPNSKFRLPTQKCRVTIVGAKKTLRSCFHKNKTYRLVQVVNRLLDKTRPPTVSFTTMIIEYNNMVQYYYNHRKIDKVHTGMGRQWAW